MPKKTRTRANNGMGSIRQRPDGRWEARYTTPDNAQRSVYGKTEKEVTTKLRSALHHIDVGMWREPSRMTVSDWLDIWLKDYQGDNSERTILKYESIVNHNFKPVIGDTKLTKLSQIHIRRLIASMKARNLSQVTISNYCRILRTALKHAVESKLIQENPAAEVSVARGAVKKFNIVEVSMFPAFESAAKKTRYEYELMFMLYSGLRIGEVRGLMWSDVDFERGTIFVQRQLHPKSQLTKRITTPKYEEERLLFLPPEAIGILHKQKRKQAEQRIASTVWVDDEISKNLVFRQKNGKPHGEKTIYTAVKNAGSLIGIPALHPHDLRHSYAIAAIRAKIDVKTVQHNLGHKTSSMTMDVYVAYTEEAGKEGASKLSEYLKSAQKNPV